MTLERKMSQGAGQLDAEAGKDAEPPAAQSGGAVALTANPDPLSTAVGVHQGAQSAPEGDSNKSTTDAVMGESGTASTTDGADSESGASSSPAPSASADRKSPSLSPYLVPEGSDHKIEQSEEGTSDGPLSASSPAVDSPSQPTPAPNGSGGTKTAGRRVRSRRLSFADELGGPLSHVTYHSNLHYAQAEEPGKAIRQPAGPGCVCLCVIS